MIDMENINKNDHRIFYFKPNSKLLETPEKQRQWRQELQSNLGNIRAPVSEKGLADQLDNELREAMTDSLSDPACMR